MSFQSKTSLLLGNFLWNPRPSCVPVLPFCCSELRERIQPEILELIKQQRLNRLCEGSCFRKLGNRRRQGISSSPSWLLFTDVLRYQSASFLLSLLFFLEKFWFCRLSLNHKVLHYGDLDESPQGEVPFELLSDKSEMLHHNQELHLEQQESL